MASFDGSSVTRWIGDLKAGGDSAAQHLWERQALRQVLDLRPEGWPREEIAQRLGWAERTVKRKLDVIREAWIEGES